MSESRVGKGLCQSFVRSWRAVLLLSALLLSGCGARGRATSPEISTRIPLTAIAVYPLQLPADFPPEYTYVKTVEMIDQVLTPRRFDVFSYGDFGMFSSENTFAYRDRSLLDLIRAEHLDPARLAVLHSAASRPDARAVGKKEGHRTFEPSRLNVTVELIHFQSRIRIARATSVLTVDPLDAVPEDPYPALTERLKRLGSKVVREALKKSPVPPALPPPPFAFYVDHSRYFDLATQDGVPLAVRLEAMDDVGRAMTLLAGYQLFYPDISVGQVQALAGRPGILVDGGQAQWVSQAGLNAGDIVTAIDGVALRARHQVDRAFRRRGPGERVRLEVWRDGRSSEIILDCP